MANMTGRPRRGRHLRRAVLAGVIVASALFAARSADEATPAGAISAPATPPSHLWAFHAPLGSTANWATVDVTASAALTNFKEPPAIVDAGGSVLAAGLTESSQVVVITAPSASSTNWSSTNLTQSIGLTSTVTPAIAVDQSGVPVLVTRATNGHLMLSVEQFSGRTAWQRYDLTALSSSPATIGRPSISITDTGTSVFSRTSAGHVISFVDTASATKPWQAVDVTALSGGPNIVTDPVVDSEQTSTQHHVAGVSVLGNVVEFADDNATLRFWSSRNFPVPSLVTGGPVIACTPGMTTIVVTLANHHLVALSGPINTVSSLWTTTDLSTSASGGSTVTGRPVLASDGTKVEVLARSDYSDYLSFDTVVGQGTPSWRALDVKASAAFSPSSTSLSAAAVGGQFLVFASGAMFTSTSGTGLYAIPQGSLPRALNDGWPVIGDTGALGTVGAPYTGLANSGQDLATGKAIAASGRPATWLSFWTVSGPPISAKLSAISCPTTCVAAGVATEFDGSSMPVMVTSAADGKDVGTWLPIPTGSAADPKAQIGAISCQQPTICTIVGSALDATGKRLPTWTTISGATSSARFVAVPTSAASNPQATLTALRCTSASVCVGLGTQMDVAGRTVGIAVATRAGTPSTARVLATPPGASVNSRMTPTSITCTSGQSCLGVGSFVDTAGRTRPWLGSIAADVAISVAAGTLALGAASNPQATYTAISCGPSTCTVVGTTTMATGKSLATVTVVSGGIAGATSAISAPVAAASNPSFVLNSVSCPTATCIAAGSAIDGALHKRPVLLAIVGGIVGKAAFSNLPAGAARSPEAVLSAIACVSPSLCRGVGGFTDSSGTEQGLATSGTPSANTAQLSVLPSGAGAANPPQAYYQASLLAGRAVGTILASYPKQGLNLQPNFVIYDPEGYPDNHSGLDGPPGAVSSAKWASALSGWADGLHQLNPGTHVGVYMDQAEYLTYNIAKLALPAFLAVAWGVHYTVSQQGTLTITAPPTPPKKIVSGPNIAGIISFNDFCPSEWGRAGDYANQVSMFSKAPWNGTYNTLQFILPTQYCGPR